MTATNKKIILSVTNDLVSDQRVHKVATSLESFGFDVTLIGRRFRNSLAIKRNYKTKRMRLLFNKKVWFYAEYNIRLFLFLLFRKFDVYVANDLDTLIPNFIISKLKNKKLVYDSHEYFTEVPELISRPRIRKIWLRIEEYIFPKLKNVITVNDVIAEIYSNKYNKNVHVIRNIAPLLKNKTQDKNLSRAIKESERMIILQGNGINIDRGSEELVISMRYLDNVILYIIGSGDVFPNLKKLIKENQLSDKVKIIGRKPYNELMEYTKISDIGISLDKGTNDNYEYSLPNKVFDYIQAETPILASNRTVISKLIKENNIGLIIKTHKPKDIARSIKNMLNNTEQMSIWKENLQKASLIYNWENESKKLLEIYSNLL